MTISNAELNRRKRVCQMCPDFQTRDNGIRTWCGRDCHGEDGKHCEVWAQFQWSKRILGPEDPCKYWENPLMQNSAILLPYVGEFGWMIQEHVRWAHAYQAASKRIWCQAGQECLFPSATAFFTDWSNPIPEDRRCWSTDWYDRGARDRFYDQLRPRLQLLFPNEEIITPQYGCRWHMSDAAEFKFRPQVRGVLPAVDVAIGPRMREFDAGRNWPHWQAFAKLLRASGIVVGVVGAPATSSSVEADVRAWQHPDGIDAGCIDVLSHCKLYVGVDSGVSHLAALVDAPTLLIERDNPDDGAGVMARANFSFFSKLSAWRSLDEVYGATVRCLRVVRSRAFGDDLAVYVLAYQDRPFLARCLDSLYARIDEDSSLKVAPHLIATDVAASTIDPYRSRLTVDELPENLGIPGSYEAVVPKVPEARYVMTAEDDVEFVRPLHLYCDVLAASREVGAASGQHSPEHAVFGKTRCAGATWLLKWAERGQCLVFRAADLESLRPFPRPPQMVDFDWWVCRDAPLNFQARHRHIAVLPGGVKHLAPLQRDSVTPVKHGDLREYTDDEIAEAGRA